VKTGIQCQCNTRTVGVQCDIIKPFSQSSPYVSDLDSDSESEQNDSSDEFIPGNNFNEDDSSDTDSDNS